MGNGRQKTNILKLVTLRGGYLDEESLTDEDFGIDKDSYIYDKEYQQMVAERDALIEQKRELSKELSRLNASQYIPEEEWDEYDTKFAKELGIRPTYDNVVNSMIEVRTKLDELETTIGSHDDSLKMYAFRRGSNVPISYLPAPKKSGETKYFTDKKTGMSYYDTFLEDPNYKGFNSYVTMMPPKEYIQRVAQQVFSSTYENQVRSVDKSSVVKYANMMTKGVKFDMPYIDLKTKNQEGRHRAFAALLLGAEEIPVLILY